MSLVDVFTAVTDGSTATSTSSDTFADVTALSVTVTDTMVGDKLVISAALPSVTAGSAGNIRYTLDIDGTKVRTTKTVEYSGVGGNTVVVPVNWTHTVAGGDITGGNTIVKVQWAKYNAGSPTVELINNDDGVGVLTVVRVRT